MLVVVIAGELGTSAWLSHRNQHSTSSPVAVDTNQASVEPTTIPFDITTVPAEPTTTAAEVSAPVVAPGSVTYTVPADTQVSVRARGTCWMEARQQAGGPIIDELTLPPGTTKTYTAPVWLRFGDSTKVTVTAGNTTLKPLPGPGDVIIRTS